MIINAHVTVSLLVAMRNHQNYEYKLHKRPIVTQLVITTITLFLATYFFCFRPLIDYGCALGERKFEITPQQDSPFCQKYTNVSVTDLFKDKVLLLFFFIEPVII